VRNGAPGVTLGTLGLFRSTQVPEIESIIIEKNNAALAYGAKGIGEIVMVTTAPAVACAYFQRDGKLRNALPLADTPYSRTRAASQGAEKEC
jgi:CO/xanthine dehydrogenase Mo-binding subunit